MRAVVYERYGELPTVREVAEPACPAHGVLVRVRATGVCRSDWHAWHGHDPVPLPMIPGHEFAGEVAVVGPDVRTVAVGDRVTAPFACGCGRCAWCRAGDAQVCPDQYQPGFTGPGSFAELVAVPAADTNVVPLPDWLGYVEAASLGCRFATAARAIFDQGRLEPGQTLAVFGCGGVGLSAIMLGVAHGCRVFACDTSAEARARAAALGAIALDGADLEAAAAAIQAAGGADVGMDAVGSAALATASLRSLRRRGRHVQVGLVFDDAALPLGLVIARELEVLGSHGMAAADYPRLLARIATASLDLSGLVGRTIALDAAGEALAAMDGPTGPGMTVVRLD